MTLKQGDIITHKDGSKQKILGVVGEVVFPSHEDEFTRAGAFHYTETELLEAGYTFPKEKWTPECGQDHFFAIYAPHCGWRLQTTAWQGNSFDIARRDSFFGIFKTEAEAQARIALIEDKLKEI